jgi:hypothetical protein
MQSQTAIPTQGPWRTATIVLGKLAVSWLETLSLPTRLVDLDGNVGVAC